MRWDHPRVQIIVHRNTEHGEKEKVMTDGRTYAREISRKTPLCVILLIDQSLSMSEEWGDERTTKADKVPQIVNKLLNETISRATKGNEIWDYYYYSLIGYGPDSHAAPAFTGALAGKWEASTSDLHANGEHVPVSVLVEGESYQVMEKSWLSPVADGNTPMAEAFEIAEKIVKEWIDRRPDTFPPIVINVTDGKWTTTDPAPVVERIKKLSTIDGECLVFNVHISAERGEDKLVFPCQEDLRDEDEFDYARSLFQMSSELPPTMVQAARARGMKVEIGARAFCFNVDNSAELLEVLEIGSRPNTLSKE